MYTQSTPYPNHSWVRSPLMLADLRYIPIPKKNAEPAGPAGDWGTYERGRHGFRGELKFSVTRESRASHPGTPIFLLAKF